MTVQRTRYRLASWLTGSACVLWAATAAAFTSPCAVPAVDASSLSLGGERGEQSRLRGSGGAEARLTRSRLAWRGQAGARRIPLGGGHEYSIYDVTPFAAGTPDIPDPPAARNPADGRGVPDAALAAPEPSANGHLHVLHADAALTPLLAQGWDLRLQAALTVSSNFLKKPTRIGREALQLNAVLLRRFDRGAAGSWLAGVCGDHRFGDWRVYPVVAWQWDSAPWSLQLGWPDTYLTRGFGETLETSVALGPDGNRWRVLDERIGDSRFVHETWRLRWALDWRPLPRWSARLYAAMLLDGEYAFTLDTAELYTGDSGSALQLGLEFRWHYAD